MRITGNLVPVNPFSRKTIPGLIKEQFKNVMHDHSLQNIQPTAVSGQPRNNSCRVYIRTGDMLYSGGNSTGLSFYIKYADYSTADNPIMIAKGIDKNGNEFEQTIRIRDIDPYHATIIEMRAMEAYLNVDKVGGLTSFPPAAGHLGLNDRIDFIAMFRKTIKDMELLGKYQLARDYSKNIQTYLDFLK